MMTTGEVTSSERVIIRSDNDTIQLRQLALDDAEAVFALIDGRRNREHLSQFHDKTAVNYPVYERFAGSIVMPANPDRLRLGIWDGDKAVGSINLTPLTENPDIGVIGYWVGEGFTGNRYAERATRILIDYGLNQKGYEALIADVVVGNVASAKTLQNAGFRLLYTFQEEEDGKMVDKWQFGYLPEWPAEYPVPDPDELIQ